MNMKYVRLTKLAGKPDSHIPVGYWVAGAMFHEPDIGHSLRLSGNVETSRNERFDWFATTHVVAFDGKIITTKNSNWELTRT